MPFADRPRWILLATMAALLGGCAEWIDRREQMTLWSGDATAANRAIHTIDPWPPGSGDVSLRTSGERARLGVERYRDGKIPSPQGLGATSTVPGGTGAPR